MIGQAKLLQHIQSLAESNFPRFTMIVGAQGSGRKLIAKHVADILNAQLITVSTKVDEIREIITLSHKQTSPTIYLIPDADRMSTAAKNALLKVTEEAPQKALFIMTVQDENQMLATLRSRAVVLHMNPYTPDEIFTYTCDKLRTDTFNGEECDLIGSICNVPGDVDILFKYNILEFYEYVEMVAENMGAASGANVFRISTKLSFKEDDGKWDISLFFKAIITAYIDRMLDLDVFLAEDFKRYCESIRTTGKYLSELSIRGISKTMLVDAWIMEMRAIWTA